MSHQALSSPGMVEWCKSPCRQPAAARAVCGKGPQHASFVMLKRDSMEVDGQDTDETEEDVCVGVEV